MWFFLCYCSLLGYIKKGVDGTFLLNHIFCLAVLRNDHKGITESCLVGAKEFRYEVKIKQCCLLSHVLKVRGTSKLAWFTLTLHI